MKLSYGKKLVLYIALIIAILSLTLDFFGSLFGASVLAIVIYMYGIGAVFFIWISRRSLPKLSSYFFKLLYREKLLALTMLLCVATLSSTVIFSWLRVPMGLYIQGGNLHDSAWHVALIKELQTQIPPRHPSAYGEVVKNYHYYYDLVLAGIANATHIQVSLLHFQVMPVLISIFLALSSIVFARSVTKNTFFPHWLLFFIYFGGSAAFMIPMFFPTKTWMESSFWVSQTFSMMINPQLLLSFALLFVLFSIPLWGDALHEKKKLISSLVITAALAGIKMYAFILAIILFGLYLVFNTSKKNITMVIASLVLVGIVSTAMFFRFTNPGKQQLLYSPLWFVNTMVEAQDRLFVPDWKLREETYIAQKAWLHLTALKFQETVVFYTGNLGTRTLMVSLPIVLFFARKRKYAFTRAETLVLWGATFGFIISTTIPLFFIQSGIVWNTIQFWYYGLIFASILVAYCLSILPGVLSIPRQYYIVASIIVILLTVPTWVQTFNAKMTTNDLIAQGVLQTATQLQPNERVLICPNGLYTNFLFKSALIRSLSDARVYLADPVQLELIGLDGSERERRYHDIIQDEGKLLKLIQTENITSVVCGDAGWNARMAPMLEKSRVTLHEL